MPELSPFAKSLSSPWQWIIAATIIAVLSIFVIGPTTNRPHSHQNYGVQSAHVIGMAMLAYANDNNGKYPTGASSTEIFQKLIDGKYITDPSIFCPYEESGKSRATSNKLKPENVGWDVTIPAYAEDFGVPPEKTKTDGGLPLLFSTGYRIEYVPHGRALPLPGTDNKYIIVLYVSESAQLITADPQNRGIVSDVIPASFDARGVKYTQLTPDGALP